MTLYVNVYYVVFHLSDVFGAAVSRPMVQVVAHLRSFLQHKVGETLKLFAVKGYLPIDLPTTSLPR